MSSNKQLPEEEVPMPELNPAFTENVLKNAQKRHLFKEMLFIIAVGFKNMIEGLFKVETVKNYDKKNKE